VVGDLPVADSHGIDCFELDGLAGGSDAEKLAAVRPVVDLEGGDDVTVDGLPVDLGPEVRKRVTQSVVVLRPTTTRTTTAHLTHADR
jgi:hypothetical protein